MHIKINKATLSEALNTVQSAATSKSALPVLQNVKVEAKGESVEFSCTDTDIGLVADVKCEVLEEGATTIPIKLFAAATSKMPDNMIEVETEDNDVSTISCGATVHRFKGLPASTFPVLPPKTGTSCVVKNETLREMIRKTSFATAQDGVRPVLAGVLLVFKDDGKTITAVSSDGRRLARIECVLDSTNGISGQYILPRKALDILSKKLPKDGDAVVLHSNGILFVSTKNLTMATKLIDGSFPNTDPLFPKEELDYISIDRAELLGALERVSVLSSAAENPYINLVFENNRLMLHSKDTTLGASSDEVPVKYEGDKFEVSFNPTFVHDVLTAIDDDEIRMSIKNNHSPTVVRRGASDEYTYLVMPLRNP